MHLLDDLGAYSTKPPTGITGLLLQPVEWHKDALGCDPMDLVQVVGPGGLADPSLAPSGAVIRNPAVCCGRYRHSQQG